MQREGREEKFLLLRDLFFLSFFLMLLKDEKLQTVKDVVFFFLLFWLSWGFFLGFVFCFPLFFLFLGDMPSILIMFGY